MQGSCKGNGLAVTSGISSLHKIISDCMTFEYLFPNLTPVETRKIFEFISKEGSVTSPQTRRAFLVVNTYSILFAMDKLQKSVPHIRQIVYRLA